MAPDIPAESNPVQRIDHVAAVVEDFQVARRLWIEVGCPVVYDGSMATHRACCVSIGSINLELLSAEAFEGWPALANWCARAGRRFGVQAVAFDPGDLALAMTALRRRGLPASEPREGRLAEARWRTSYVDGLAGLLPGLPSFLCEFLSPAPHLGRSLPGSPVQAVELRVGCAAPDATLQAWRRVVGDVGRPDGDGYVVELGDTAIRLVPGDGFTLVVKHPGTPASDHLAAAVPGVRFVS